MIPADDPVRLLSAFVEGMDLSELYATYDRVRKNQASPRQMLKIMIYASMNHLFSSRDIETACFRETETDQQNGHKITIIGEGISPRQTNSRKQGPRLHPQQLFDCSGYALFIAGEGNAVCDSLHLGHGVCHGDAAAGSFQHGDVIVAVSEDHHLVHGKTEV